MQNSRKTNTVLKQMLEQKGKAVLERRIRYGTYQNQMSTTYKKEEKILKDIVRRNCIPTKQDEKIELKIFHNIFKVSKNDSISSSFGLSAVMLNFCLSCFYVLEMYHMFAYHWHDIDFFLLSKSCLFCFSCLFCLYSAFYCSSSEVIKLLSAY